MTPAQHVISQFGSYQEVADALGLSFSTVWRWAQPKSIISGQNGIIPARYHLQLLALAKKRHLDLKPEDLVVGRK